MPTFKDNRLEVVRDAVEPMLLGVMQRVVRQVLWRLAKHPAPHFKSDGQVALRNYIGRLSITEALMYVLTPRISSIVGAELLPT
jgi:hypothetical protein